MFSALALPPDTDREALKHTKVFYYIMGFPLILNFLMAVLLFTVITIDSPKYYMVNGNKESSLKAIKKIYRTEDDDAYAEEISDFIKSTIQTQSTKVTLKAAFFTDERYRRASWVSLIYIIFHELTGINVIELYSNTILETILGTDTSGFTARQGTYVLSMF